MILLLTVLITIITITITEENLGGLRNRGKDSQAIAIVVEYHYGIISVLVLAVLWFLSFYMITAINHFR